MSKDIVRPSDSVLQTGHVRQLLENEGVPNDVWQLPIDSKAARVNLAKFWTAGCPSSWPGNVVVGPVYGETPTKRAMEIVKTSYGPDIVEKHFPWKFTRYQRSSLETVPFSETFLEQVAHTHGLLARHASASVMSIKHAMLKVGYKKLWYTEKWYHAGDQEFASTPMGNGWLLIRKDEAPDSCGLDYPSSLGCLSSIEIPPLCAEGTLFAQVHCMETDERLFTKKCIRFRDRSAGDDRVYAGFYDDGWGVDDWRDGDASPNLGLGSALRTS